MSVINPLAREISAKIVYYGPGLSGKTTSLQFIHEGLKPANRGDLISLATEGDRTLYFDFLPVHLGRVRDLNVRLQLYTVPGQVFYGATRKLVLDGADGVVFVADSQSSAQERNVESLEDLEANLKEMGTSLKQLPFVLQYNKRDLPACDSLEELRRVLNKHDAPDFATAASEGKGVLEALKTMTRLVTTYLTQQSPSEQPAPSLRRPLTPPTSLRPSVMEVKEFQTQVSHALDTLEGTEAQPSGAPLPSPDIPPLPSAPHLTDLGKTAPPPIDRPAAPASPEPQSEIHEIPNYEESDVIPSHGAMPSFHPTTPVPRDADDAAPTNNALTIQAPAVSPLSFAALWEEDSLVRKIEEDISAGYFAEAVYRATGGVSTILDTLLGPHSPETSATRAQLLGLDGHEYLELRRLGSRPASTLTQREALFALYVLIAAHVKEQRLGRK